MKFLSLFTWLSLSLMAAAWTEHFSFEEIAGPPGVDPQVGAMETMPDGRLAVAFHRGDVMIYDPLAKTWSPFASGLQEPLGMLADKDGSLLVMQRAELTRLRDTDNDGNADEYETVFDDFGMSGNYHEFSYGPARDAQGNLYIVLGVASNGAPMAKEIRGEFSQIGKVDFTGMTTRETWGKNRNAAGRMYSRVKWRGWVLKLSPDGKSMEPFASGFRSPNGIGFDASGRLLITDNQGDWRPTSPLYSVKKGGFHGHPASLVWTPGWDGKDPYAIPVPQLDQMQVPAVGYFPQGELANSPTWPVVIPEGSFPASWSRQTLIGEMNQKNLVRVLEDNVEGVFQAALVPVFNGSPLGMGSNRLAFGKDGSLYVGKTALSWAGGKGITRVKWKGTAFLSLDQIKARKEGFALRFSQPLDATSLETLAVTRHTYDYHQAYGAPKKDLTKLDVKNSKLSADGITLTFEIGALKEKYLHLIDMSGLKGRGGEKVLGHKAWYQVIKAPK